jgi:hypothetical protein
MSIQSFNPAVLNSYDSLSRYLSGQEELQEILEAPKQAGPVLSNWEIVWICIKLPFDLLIHAILAAVSELYQKFGYQDLAKRCKVLSNYLLYDLQTLRTQLVFKEKFIARSFAHYHPDHHQIYLQPPIQPDDLQDERVKEVAYSDFPTQFYHENGLCRGQAHWFFHIFTQLSSHFKGDLEGQIRAAARVLEKGGCPKAGLVHALYDPERELFNFQIRALFSLNQRNFTTHAAGVARLNAFETGCYQVNFANHFLHFIKEADGSGYIIDPAYGVFKLSTPQECYEYLMQYWANEEGLLSPEAFMSIDHIQA